MNIEKIAIAATFDKRSYYCVEPLLHCTDSKVPTFGSSYPYNVGRQYPKVSSSDIHCLVKLVEYPLWRHFHTNSKSLSSRRQSQVGGPLSPLEFLGAHLVMIRFAPLARLNLTFCPCRYSEEQTYHPRSVR